MPKRDGHQAHPGDRLRADHHRPGLRVRLLRHPGLPRAAQRGLPRQPDQLQPGDDHDRPGVRRRHLHRAADAGVRRAGHRRASGPDALLATLGGQTALNLAVDLHELGRARQVRRRADRRRHRRHPARRGPAEVQGDRPAGRRRGSRVAGVPRRSRTPSSSRPPSATRSSSGRRSRWAASARAWPTAPTRCARWWRAGWPRARCTRCWSRSRCFGWKEFELELMRDRHDNVVSSARSRTSTRWACTPATRSPSRRR